jgi:ParB family chromosome partitioning protein
VEYVTSSAFQPRLNIQPDALEQLAESIKAQGILQPIVVRPKGENHYEIVAGERRWRAAQLAGLHIIPALVREIPDEAALAIALIENIQRENLNAIEEAKALKRLADDLQLTHLQVAEAIGKSRTSVTNLVRLLTLNEEVQGLLESKSLEMGHARALLGVRGPLQTQVAKTVVARGLSVRETERIINKLQENMGSLRPKVACDPNIQRLEEDLADKLGATVVIRHSNKKGQGTLMIRYSDVDQLEGILAHLK